MKKNNLPVGLAHNVLTANTVIQGDISSTKDIRVDGTILGNITSTGKVIIGPIGVVKGSIQASSVEIMGQVSGNVRSEELFSLKASGKFEGEISTRVIAIETHASFTGKCILHSFTPSDL